MENLPHKRISKKIFTALFALVFACTAVFSAPHQAFAVSCVAGVSIGAQCRVILTSGTSWTVPSDWSSTNTIEVVGGGGGGGSGFGSGSTFNNGGGGGGYAKISNLSLTAGAGVTYQIGAAGLSFNSGTSGGDTYFNGSGSTCSAQSVCTKGGTGGGIGGSGTGGEQTGNTGGVGTTINKGGNGAAHSSTSGGGAGGAGGGTGDGAAGTAASSVGGPGGKGDSTSGGAGGGAGAAGSAGAEWSTAGSGGGGGGGTTSSNGGAGGNYGGGGGGGGGGGTSTSGGNGTQGVLVITYTPFVAVAPTVTTNSANAVVPTIGNLFGAITATGGVDATQSGFAYGTNSTLSSGVSTTTLGAQTGTASFTSQVTGLSTNTTYFYRAYATNSAGTGYGSISSFSTGNTTPSRRMRLFEGFKIKLISGKVKLYGF